MRKALLVLCLLAVGGLVATPVMLRPTLDQNETRSPAVRREMAKPDPMTVDESPTPPSGEVDAWSLPPENVTGTTGAWYEYSGYGYSNGMAVDAGGNLHISYYTTGVTPAKVVYRKWTRATQTWGLPETLSSTLAASYRGGIAVDNSNNIHVVWYRSTAPRVGIWYRKYNAATSTWLPETLLATTYGSGAPGEPSIACTPGAGNVHVVWTQRDSFSANPTYLKVRHLEYIPSTGWGTKTVVSLDTATTAYWGGVAVDASNNVHVSWYQYGAGQTYYRIWYRARTSGTWGAIEQVSPADFNSYYQYYPDIEVTPSGTPHIAWNGYSVGGSSYYRIFYRNRSGGTWGNVDTVSTYNSYYNYYPALGLAGDTVHTVWRGYSGPGDGYYHVQYRRRLPSGTWGSTDSLTSWNANAYYLNVRPDRGEVHVVWYDYWNGSTSSYSDVWYRRRLQDPNNDIAAVSVDSIWPFQPRNASAKVAATVRNAGLLTQSSGIPVIMNITSPGGYTYADTAYTAAAIDPGMTLPVVFTPNWTTPTVKGPYTIQVRTALPTEQNRSNDTARTTVEVYPGFYETFTATTWQADNGWQVYNFDGGDAWTRFTTYYSTAPASARCYYDAPNNDWLITPRLGPVVSDDSIVFYFRTYSTSYTETLTVRASTTSQTDTSTFTTTLGQMISTNNTTWRRLSYDLGSLTGNTVYIAFVYKNDDAYGVLVDDVMGPPVWMPDTDVAVIGHPLELTYPLRPGDAETTAVWVQNKARLPFSGSFNVYLTGNGSPLGSATFSGALAVGESALVNVGFTPTQSDIRLNFQAHHDLATDQRRSNDTMAGWTDPFYGVAIRFNDWVFPVGTWEAHGLDWGPDSIFPVGWDIINNDGGTQYWNWYIGYRYHSGWQYVGSRYETSILRNDDWIVTDTMTPQAGFADSVGVWFRGSSTSYRESLEVWVLDSQSVADTLARIWAGNTANDTLWHVARASLDDFDGQPVVIGFRNHGLYQGTLYADDAWFSRNPLPDVGVAAVIAPSGDIQQGTVVTPRVRLRNYGLVPATFSVRLTVGTYDQTETGISLAAGDSLLYSFATSWTATPAGGYTAVAYTILAEDYDASNDTARSSGMVYVVPAAPVLVSPPDASSTPDLTPSFLWRSSSSANLYQLQVDTAAGFAAPVISQNLADTTFTPGSNLPRDQYFWHVRASADNGMRWGDWSGAWSFAITAPAETGWVAKAPVPAGPKGKKVKDGACAAFLPVTDSEYVWLLKGNNRVEFYAYNTETNTWATRESISAIGSSGKKKGVKKGATLAADRHGTRLYAAKGANTLDWWRYDPLAVGVYPWTQMANVPAGAKGLKEGVGSAWIRINDTGYVFLLRGSTTTDFHRYCIETNTWTNMAPAPTGVSGKTYKNGSALTIDRQTRTIYAIKGSYGEFYAYNIDGNTWSTLTTLPRTGSTGKKKVKDGCGLAYSDGVVYALKGGNTREFWYFLCDSNRWTEWHEMPLGGGKKVKGGGTLTYAGRPVDQGDALYATKGNNTDEFYTHPPLGFFVPTAEPRTAAMGGSQALPDAALRVTPNPFSGQTRISYTLPRAGIAALKLYDVTGSLVSVLREGYGPAGSFTGILDAHELSRGIYLLKLETETKALTFKLIIE